MAEQARSALDDETLEVVADRGYYAGEEILACEEAGITATQAKRKVRPCAATGQRHVRRAHRKPNARPARNAGSNAGSTKPFLKRCKRGSTAIRARCAFVVRPWSTHLERSSRGWDQPTSR